MLASLSIIIPVLNEAENLPLIVDRLEQSLGDHGWEVVFVNDESKDNSQQVLRELVASHSQVRFLNRIGRRGLSSAVIEGALTSPAPIIAVMDGDLQHDETLLPEMLDLIRRDQANVVVGSRFLEQSDHGSLSSGREKMSRLGNWLSRLVIKTRLSDPLSGFFMLKREVFDTAQAELSGTGFKILIDILASTKSPIRLAELPFEFGQRLHGVSKIDSLVTLEFLMLLGDKWLGKWIPVRFLLFTAVGGLGVGIHIAILGLLYKGLGYEFYISQISATLITMAVNFTLNNTFTYRDRRLRGKSLLVGILSFYLVCSIGAVANLQFAEFLFNHQTYWALAGFAGAVVGAVWNYAMTSVFTWTRKASN